MTTDPATATSGALPPVPQPAPAVIPASASAPVAAQTLPSAPPQPVQQQVFAAMVPLLRGPDGGYAVQLQLHPHDLGAVQVTVDLRHGEISVQLHSGDAAARDALRDGLSDLRQQLEDQGLRAGSLEVGAGGADPRRRPDQQPVTRGITIPGGATGAVTDPHLTAAANVPASATALDLRM